MIWIPFFNLSLARADPLARLPLRIKYTPHTHGPTHRHIPSSYSDHCDLRIILAIVSSSNHQPAQLDDHRGVMIFCGNSASRTTTACLDPSFPSFIPHSHLTRDASPTSSTDSTNIQTPNNLFSLPTLAVADIMGTEQVASFNLGLIDAEEALFSRTRRHEDSAAGSPMLMSTSVPSTFLPSYYPISRDPDFTSFAFSTAGGSGSGSGSSSNAPNSFHGFSQSHPTPSSFASTAGRPGLPQSESPETIERLSAAGPSTRHLLDGVDIAHPPRPPQPSTATSFSASWPYGDSFSGFDNGGSASGTIASGTGHSSASPHPPMSDPWEGFPFAMDQPSPTSALGMAYQPTADLSATNLMPSPQPAYAAAARHSTSRPPNPQFSSSSSVSSFLSSGHLSAQSSSQNLPHLPGPHSTTTSPFHAPLKFTSPPGQGIAGTPMQPVQSAPAGSGTVSGRYHDSMTLQDPQPTSINYPMSLFGTVPLSTESEQTWTGMGMPRQQGSAVRSMGDEYAQVSALRPLLHPNRLFVVIQANACLDSWS